MIRVGFVGLGSMGLPMAANLLRAQIPVCGYDLNPEALRRLEAAGGTAAASAAEAAAPATISARVRAARPKVFNPPFAAPVVPPVRLMRLPLELTVPALVIVRFPSRLVLLPWPRFAYV